MKLLVDTSALLALALRNDQHHAAAARFLQQNPGHRFVLTELILAETVTRLRARAGVDAASAAASSLLGSRRFEVVFADGELVRGALALMRRYQDKLLSLADCASFELMRRLELGAAFTFDRDFRDCGFEMVPETRAEPGRR